MAKTKLNIFLAKTGVSIEDIIRNLDPAPNCIQLNENAKFYFKEANDVTPRWVDSFFGEELDNVSLTNKTIQAVLLKSIPVNENECRVFAITFGLGRNLLRLDRFEERFGLITAMNMMDPAKLRSLTSSTIDSNPKNSQIMMGKRSSLKAFDLNSDYDVLKNINGRIEANRFGDAVSASGRQSLSISVSANFENIDGYLEILYGIFYSNEYQEKFPGIDHTYEIKDKELIDQLDDFIIRDLKGEGHEAEMSISLCLPEFVRDSDISGFVYGRSVEVHDDIDLDEMLFDIAPEVETLDISMLKNQNLVVINNDNQASDNWRLYRCLIVDCLYEGNQYVLNDGKWYEYDQNYAAMINDYYNAAEMSDIDLIDYRNDFERENTYNENAANALDNGVMMDCTLINPFRDTPYEVCDIYDLNSESFIHVKKKTGSAAMSHLFLQGFVSAEALRSKEVRTEIIRRKPEMMGHVLTDSFDAERYTVVFAIIEKNNDDHSRPKLPFFSKVSFRHISRQLETNGYKVCLKSIPRR